MLRLWPGLYFDSDTINGLGIGAMNTGEKLLEGDGAAVRMQVLLFYPGIQLAGLSPYDKTLTRAFRTTAVHQAAV